jgi:predicted enzyme related to lactoylglutathione lyase
MAGRMERVWFWVGDMGRAVAFYAQALGLELLNREGDEWADLATGPVRLSLHGTRDGQEAPAGGTVVFEVEDLDASMFEMGMRGVRFDGPVGEVGGVARYASFADPDGNRLQLIEYLEEH